MRTDTVQREQLTVEGFLKVVAAIFVSGLAAHFAAQLVSVVFGSRPAFFHVQAISITCAVVGFFLIIGWAIRRVWLATLIFIVCGLAFLFPHLFVLHGSLRSWLMQFVLYVGTPLVSFVVFQFLTKKFDLPDRPCLGNRG